MDNRNGPSILLSVSLLPNKDIKIPNPLSHLVLFFRIVPVFTSPLWYLELTQSMYSLIKVPILLGWPGSFSSMYGFAFDWVATWAHFFNYFLNGLILQAILSRMYGSVVLIIIYWFSNLSATHKFCKNDLCSCFNSWVKMLNNKEYNADLWGAS